MAGNNMTPFNEILKYYWYNKNGNPVDPRNVPLKPKERMEKGYRREIIAPLGPQSTSSGQGSQFEDPANYANFKAAQKALIPTTPRRPNNNKSIMPPRKTPCNGVGCSVMGGRRKTRRTKTRRTKTRRNRH
jgi:hypothetical protein